MQAHVDMVWRRIIDEKAQTYQQMDMPTAAAYIKLAGFELQSSDDRLSFLSRWGSVHETNRFISALAWATHRYRSVSPASTPGYPS